LSKEGDRSRELVLWGASGHGKVVLDVGRSQGSFDSIVFIDDRYKELGPSFLLCPVLGGLEALPSVRGCSFLVSIGDNAQRARCYAAAVSQQLAPATLIHRTATIAPSAVIGGGTVVMPGAIVNACARIGDNCIVNTGTIIEHDCVIGDHVHLSPGVLLGGAVTVGNSAHVGMGAVVLPGVHIGESAVVGAGSVVLKSVPPGATVAGVPSRSLHSK
jgi:sugar O-acyltransferase (sialic acid O-acetyltransferase NeuD family)